MLVKKLLCVTFIRNILFYSKLPLLTKYNASSDILCCIIEIKLIETNPYFLQRYSSYCYLYSFMLYPKHSRVGRINLRTYSIPIKIRSIYVPYSPPNSRGIAS